MAKTLLDKMQRATELAQNGVKQCITEKEKLVWFATFSCPMATSNNIAKLCNISPKTARYYLNRLSEKGLLYADKSVTRNRRYMNYDLLRIIS